jgi:hypothetical protein
MMRGGFAMIVIQKFHSMTPLRKLFGWYMLFLAAVFVMLFFALGREAVLTESAKVKPYAVVFRGTDEIRAARAAHRRLIFFFGDSSVAQPPWARKDSPHIPALLEKELQKMYPEAGGVTVVDWAFDGARIFHYFCLLYAAKEYRPDLIIIPINWRSLGHDSWERDEKYAFRDLSALIPLGEREQPYGKILLADEHVSAVGQALNRLRRPLLYASGLRFWGRTRIGIEQKDDPLESLMSVLPPVNDLMAQYSDKRLFEQYPLVVAENNSLLKEVEALSRAAAENGLTVLFYITPIHMGEMSRRSGFDEAAYLKSAEVIRDSANAGDSACIDLSRLLREDDFIDCFEHYSPAGNQAVARALVPEAAQLLLRKDKPPAVMAAPAGKSWSLIIPGHPAGSL